MGYLTDQLLLSLSRLAALHLGPLSQQKALSGLFQAIRLARKLPNLLRAYQGRLPIWHFLPKPCVRGRQTYNKRQSHTDADRCSKYCKVGTVRYAVDYYMTVAVIARARSDHVAHDDRGNEALTILHGKQVVTVVCV